MHRIGRTGRAGRSGEAISLVSPDEEKLLKGIERMTKQKIADGDLMGFDASTIEAEKPETREPRQPRQARGERKPRGERSKPAEQGEPKERQGRNRRAKSKTKAPAAAGETGQAITRPPQLPPERDPEVFLDDDLDNFGNRVDYVSPYQNKQGRGRRPGAPGKPGAAQPRAANGQRGAAGSGKGKRGPDARGGQPRRKNDGGRSASASSVQQEAAVRPPEKKPLIIHKESKIDRLPSAEQLDQLPQRPRGEKPALLTRNR